ncbi:MAG: hypothetical protein IJ738_05720 [Alphaproteobacteria bacterium]|nr:hypothetical protein [Alphaproteobacteria bacterium]MBR1757043.1 hypothetical protein [Alphaproteobacteria bacterium]
MSYKEKHIHQLHNAFGILVLSAATLIPSGCTFNKEKTQQTQEQGLLDPTPLKTNDKYNESVTLYLVDVPIYNRNGERKTDQYVLTRGLKSSEYSAESDARYIRKAYINGANEPVYVQVDANNAVVTSRKFAGLFLDDDGKVVVVADNRVSDFIKERTAQRFEARRLISSNQHERIPVVVSETETTDSTKYNASADSIRTDTILAPIDSLLDNRHVTDSGKIQTDTLKQMRQETRE